MNTDAIAGLSTILGSLTAETNTGGFSNTVSSNQSTVADIATSTATLIENLVGLVGKSTPLIGVSSILDK